VDLQKPIAKWILYGTSVVQEDGEVHFLEDIYGHGAALETAFAVQKSSSMLRENLDWN